MSSLLEAASVTRGDGPWSAGTGEEFDSYGCAMSSYTVDICNGQDRTGRLLSGNENAGTDSTEGLTATMFAVVASLSGRLRCMAGDEPQRVEAAMEAETEHGLGKELWEGLGGTADAFIGDTGGRITTAAAGANTQEALGNAIDGFFAIATGIAIEDAILHVGTDRALDLSIALVEDGKIKNLGMPMVYNPGYPANGMAITGPIAIRLGTVEVLEGTPNVRQNTGHAEASRLVSIQFDPCHAVRVA